MGPGASAVTRTWRQAYTGLTISPRAAALTVDAERAGSSLILGTLMFCGRWMVWWVGRPLRHDYPPRVFTPRRAAAARTR